MPSDHPSPAVADRTHDGQPHRGRLHKFLLPVPQLKDPIDPALLKHAEERAEVRQNRVADKITAFSGSMLFVYLHIIWFSCWIGFGVEKYPFGLLTMIVSLEAIFLSIFVLISQNRQAAKDSVRSGIEYEVNVKAELEVAHLHEKTDRIYENMLARFTHLEKAIAQQRHVDGAE